MQFHRIRLWLVVLAVTMGTAASARAQREPEHSQEVQPFGPVDLGNVQDMQLFAPIPSADMDAFPKGNYGPFFRYERLYWSIRQPESGLIGNGDPNLVGVSSNTNQFLDASFVWGNRFDIGYRLCDGTGWMTSIVKSNTQFSTAFEETTPTTVAFLDPLGILPGDFPPFSGLVPNQLGAINYSDLTLVNSTRFVGVELLKTIRYEPEHHGGVWELMFGPRFFQFHDRFDARGTTEPVASAAPDGLFVVANGAPPPPTILVTGIANLTGPAAPNFWDLGIDNNIVGPEIGARWTKQVQHWTLSADFRALFGANFQNATEQGAIGQGYTIQIVRADTGANIGGPTQVGINGQPLNAFSNAMHNVTFAPLGELRMDAIYQLTKNAYIEVGYTGILASGIGRASNRLAYVAPNMGIVDGADKQHTYINGVNFGFNVNY